jgi:hypothetical protein
MSEQARNLAWGIIYLMAGAAILKNLDTLATFDQRSGVKLNSWFKRKLGDSFLNREIYSVGTPSGLWRSKIGLRIAGVICLLAGLFLVSLSCFRYL